MVTEVKRDQRTYSLTRPDLRDVVARTRSSSGDSSRLVSRLDSYFDGPYEDSGQRGLSIPGVKSLVIVSMLLEHKIRLDGKDHVSTQKGAPERRLDRRILIRPYLS